MLGRPPVLHFRIDLSLKVYSFLLANRVNSFSSSLDNWSVSFCARHFSMVAALNVGRLHEVVELATLEADTFSLTYISAEFSSFRLFFGVLKVSILDMQLHAPEYQGC